MLDTRIRVTFDFCRRFDSKLEGIVICPEEEESCDSRLLLESEILFKLGSVSVTLLTIRTALSDVKILENSPSVEEYEAAVTRPYLSMVFRNSGPPSIYTKKINDPKQVDN